MITSIMKKHLKKKKGFTLIEVVVVLVILAILAAIAVPALTGYINDARQRTTTTEARTVLVGLQHMASTQQIDGANYFQGTDGNGTLNDDGKAQLERLTGLGQDKVGAVNSIGISNNQQVTTFRYNDGRNSVLYQNGQYTIE